MHGRRDSSWRACWLRSRWRARWGRGSSDGESERRPRPAARPSERELRRRGRLDLITRHQRRGVRADHLRGGQPPDDFNVLTDALTELHAMFDGLAFLDAEDAINPRET